MDTVTIQAGVTMQPVIGARPVIVHSDGSPPRVHLYAGAVLDGVWLSGVKLGSDRPITLNDGTKIKNCVIHNYYGGIAEGGNTNHEFTNNRFISCGSGSFYHDMYISNGHAPGGCLIQGNIHIGGEGYKAHLFNGVNSAYPSNVQLLNNFYADGQWSAAAYGTSHTIQDNIFWSDTQITITLQDESTFDFSHNVIGLHTHRVFYKGNPGQSAANNAIVDGAPSVLFSDEIGTNLSVWQESDIVTNLGKSSAQIDSAIAALETAFGQTVQQIHDDATIEGQFTTLKAVIDTWKAA
jgi:hypothetical protein